jgi:hypothetical protein
MRLIGAVLSVVLLACGSAPKAPPLLDLQGKTFKPQPGVARIYVYRLGKPWLGRYDSRIFVDRANSYVGAISKNLYLFADVPAGNHSVTAVTVLYDKGNPRNIAQNSLTLDTAEGEVYFVRVEVAGTWSTEPPQMRLISTAEGIHDVQECRLAQR